MTEMLPIVDDQDKVIGKKTRDEVEKKAMLHRSANVIIEDSNGMIFVHQRKKDKFYYPGLWDIKVGGAVQYHESYLEAAKRELAEEAGINGVSLKFLFSEKYRSKEHNTNRQVYLCTWDGPIKIQKEEIEQGRFMSLDEIDALHDQLSPTAKVILKLYRQNVKKNRP